MFVGMAKPLKILFLMQITQARNKDESQESIHNIPISPLLHATNLEKREQIGNVYVLNKYDLELMFVGMAKPLKICYR